MQEIGDLNRSIQNSLVDKAKGLFKLHSELILKIGEVLPIADYTRLNATCHILKHIFIHLPEKNKQVEGAVNDYLFLKSYAAELNIK